MRAVGLELLEELSDVLHTRMRVVVHCLPLIIDDLELHLD
jgi:hypothetical protein